MQSALFVSSLAVAAARSTVTFPAVFDNTKHISNSKSKHGTSNSKSKSTDSVLASLAVDAKLKAEGINMRTTHFNDPGNFFEITFGLGSNCDDMEIGSVRGWQVGRCMNVIGNDNLDGKGQTRSRILSEPHNEGFPMVTVFDGHGCVPDNAIDSFRMDKESSDLGGFPSDYTVGECAPFYAADGSTILYMGKASWETERHEPDYNSVMSGSDTKNKACKKEKFFTYHVLHARNDICFEDDGKYYSWDVATCDDDKVYRFEYSDFTCSTRIDAVEVPAADCSFDVDPFTESYTAGGADMLYTTRACHKEYPSAP